MILGGAGGAPDAVGAVVGAPVGEGVAGIFFLRSSGRFGPAVAAVLPAGLSFTEEEPAEGATAGKALAAGLSSIEEATAGVAAGAAASAASLPAGTALLGPAGSTGAC